MGWPTIIAIEGCQWCVVLHEGRQWCEIDTNEEGSYSITIVSPSTKSSMMNQLANKIGKTFPPFVHKYTIENCKYKGGDLGESKQGISFFPISLKAQNTKIGLCSDRNTKQKLGFI